MLVPKFKASGVPLFKATGIPAIDINCEDCGCLETCAGCTELTPNVEDACAECLPSDDAAFSVPRDLKVSISGVLAGTVSNCGLQYVRTPALTYGTGSGCEATAAASNIGFFNGDIILGPCEDIDLVDCVFLCNWSNPFVFVTNCDVFEFNRIEIVTDTHYNVDVRIASWVLGMVNSASNPDCSEVLRDSEGDPTYSRLYSRRVRRVIFQRDTGVHQQWRYVLATCPETLQHHETLEYCNYRVDQKACAPAGWSITEISNTSTVDKTTAGTGPECYKANDVNSATITVETV